jgi:hypothetical protein
MNVAEERDLLMADPLTDAQAQPIPLDRIKDDVAISPRLKLLPSQVKQFALIMRERGIEPFPAVVLAARRDDGFYRVLDGRHRVAAGRLAGVAGFPAVVRPPMSERELFAEAVRLSSCHGLKLNNREKRQAVDQLVRDFTEKEKSTRELAEIAGVSHSFVAGRRRKLQQGPRPEKEPGRRKPPQYWMARLLQAFDALGALVDDPHSAREVSAAAARAASEHYEDTDPALHLEALGEWALDLRRRVSTRP